MPGWSWVVIWTCLVLALLAVLVVSAWRLFHRAVAVLRELGALAEKAAMLDGARAQREEERTELAILGKRADLRARWRLARDASTRRRNARHAARLDRAHALTRFDPNSRRWFDDHDESRSHPE